MSEILTLEKTIDLGFQLQKDSLDFLKYVENKRWRTFDKSFYL